MPPLHDPLTGRTVFIAPGRDARPNDFAGAGSERRCPFCAGAEADTPEAVDRVDDESGRWLTRVVPNAYPIVTGDEGAHEVVIESPRHVCRFVDLTEEEATAAVTAWSRRLAFHAGAGRFGYTLLFKNEGRAAGASLEHVHSQVVALPEPPPAIAREWAQALPCPAGEPLGVWEGLAVATPRVPRVPLETWILPVENASLDESAGALAKTLQRVLQAIEPPAFNALLHVSRGPSAPWRLEIVPRGSSIAGFELATGCWINPSGPDEAAARLKEKLADPAA